MEILVIDGQGGRIGQQLIKAILTRYPQVEVTAIGTNSLATSAMLKGGASQGATGENALLVACRRADVILGPLGIVIADALMGEISPAMAVAVGQARARRILIPLNQCDNLVAGVAELPVARLLESAVGELGKLLPEKVRFTAPIYYSFNKEVIKPKYNPLDTDMLLEDALDACTTEHEKDSLRSLTTTETTNKNFSLSNVKFNIATIVGMGLSGCANGKKLERSVQLQLFSRIQAFRAIQEDD